MHGRFPLHVLIADGAGSSGRIEAQQPYFTDLQIDATPFRQWYEAHYGVEVSRKKTKKAEKEAAEKAEKGEAKQSKHVMRKVCSHPLLFLFLSYSIP